MNERGLFSSRMGFILAAAGAAVGLGNIWRFPYLAAEYGGGIFLLVYLILVVTLGFTIMITEIAVGRSTGTSVVTAFAKLNRKYTFIGYLSLLVPLIILPYYSLIGGWGSMLRCTSWGRPIPQQRTDFSAGLLRSRLNRSSGHCSLWHLRALS